MPNPLIQKLQLGANLSEQDHIAIKAALSETRRFRAKVDLVGEGSQPAYVHGMLSGFACRYKALPNGRKQIVALLVPGDFCDLHVHILGTMDHTISTISASNIAILSRQKIEELITSRPAVARAMWWASLVDEGTLREWLLSIGQRSALERMAHLFCELRLRLQSVGLVRDSGFDFPVSQANLAHLLGLSLVHANRTLQELRATKLVEFRSRQVRIVNLSRLEALATFDPNYLHLGNDIRVDPKSW